MRYRKLSPTGDYVFGNSQLDFYKDTPEAVGQSVETRLTLWLGEFFLNIDDGTPYLQGILGKYSQATADLTIQDRVLATEGVINIENYVSTLNADTRMMTVSFDLNTIYGPTQVQIANYTTF